MGAHIQEDKIRKAIVEGRRNVGPAGFRILFSLPHGPHVTTTERQVVLGFNNV